MKSTTIIAAFACIFVASPSAVAQRTFTSSDGRTIEAEIVGATESEVTLRKQTDGKSYTFALDRLSKDDQEYVRKWLTKVEANTRPEKEITLSLEGGKTKTIKIPASEYLSKDGVLTLYPGDEVHLQFKMVDGDLRDPEVVTEITEPDRAITFKLTQDAQITGLFRQTKIQKTVGMDCEHRGLGNDQFFRTNLYPTEKGLMAGDSWPGTVWTIRLKNIKVTDRPASEVYEERVAK